MLEITDFDRQCFFIAPIGSEGDSVRMRSDAVRDYVVKPAVVPLGLSAVRADDVARPGQITLQVIEHVLRSKGAVADLTGNNPNVYYELAIRHTAQLPVVLIAEEDHKDKLPFDLSQMRTIFFDHRDLRSADRCKNEITTHLRNAIEHGAVDSPVSTSLSLQELERGTSVEKTVAELVGQVERLASEVSQLPTRLTGGQMGIEELTADFLRGALAGQKEEAYEEQVAKYLELIRERNSRRASPDDEVAGENEKNVPGDDAR